MYIIVSTNIKNGDHAINSLEYFVYKMKEQQIRLTNRSIKIGNQNTAK